MLSRVPATSSLPDALTVIGSAGSVLGGFVALTFSPHLRREALESLALGAAVGATCGFFAVFLAYLLTNLPT
jgi:hypothetical protein